MQNHLGPSDSFSWTELAGEKTLAPTDAVVREKTGCISPMAIRHHVGMASTHQMPYLQLKIFREKSFLAYLAAHALGRREIQLLLLIILVLI